mmetsp:Transcript_16689/g.43031  ORF Transcript_16689/g.43031 Transcript_16689/m.43031 type:complete len:207 (+) Transcript_16689:264-884(+)
MTRWVFCDPSATAVSAASEGGLTAVARLASSGVQNNRASRPPKNSFGSLKKFYFTHLKKTNLPQQIQRPNHQIPRLFTKLPTPPSPTPSLRRLRLLPLRPRHDPLMPVHAPHPLELRHVHHLQRSIDVMRHVPPEGAGRGVQQLVDGPTVRAEEDRVEGRLRRVEERGHRGPRGRVDEEVRGDCHVAEAGADLGVGGMGRVTIDVF